MVILGRTRKARRAFWLLLGVCAALALAGQTARADGKTYFARVDDTAAMRPLMQREQRAAIVCRDGVERLVIAVNVELDEDAEALWIFPVPGTPQEVAVDFVDSFPAFEGSDPFAEAESAIGGLGALARMTQIWPVFLEMFGHLGGSGAGAGVAVHTPVERWGMRAEVVTAESAEALAQYLRDKASTLDAAELNAFEPYMSDQYVLVVAWIASREQLREEFPDYGRPSRRLGDRWPCIYVEFPSERPFYPMRPTSTYGEEYIRVVLFVAGYVRPQAQADKEYGSYTSHFWTPGPLRAGPARFLQALPKGRLAYSRYGASGLAKDFKEDLWFDPLPVPDTTYARVVTRLLEWIPTYIVLIAALSYLAGGLAGLLMFRQWRPYARVGLWNLLTIFAVDLAVWHTRDSRGLPLLTSCGEGFWHVEFWSTFTGVYVGITIVFCWLLALPLRW